jgi:hypothetical protein
LVEVVADTMNQNTQKLHQQPRHTTSHHGGETTEYTPIGRKSDKNITPQKK